LSMKSPKEVISAFEDINILIQIAQEKKFPISDKFKKNIVDNLAVYISNIGLLKLLQSMPHLELLELASKKVKFEGEPKRHPKLVLSKKLLEQMELEGPLKFLDSLEESFLDKIIDDMDIDISKNKNKSVAILAEADALGLENFFSSFSTVQLHNFVDTCGLSFESNSREALINCLCEQKDYKTPKNKKKAKPSSKKPTLKKGIKKVDLIHYFNRVELLDWCKDHDLKTSGSKKELIQRILDDFDGKTTEKKKSPKKKGSKRKRSASLSEEQKSPKKTKMDESEGSKKEKEKGKEKVKGKDKGKKRGKESSESEDS